MYILYPTGSDDADAFIIRHVDSNRALFVHTEHLPQTIETVEQKGWQWSDFEEEHYSLIAYTFNSLNDIPELFI